jgi:hypothetical protein
MIEQFALADLRAARVLRIGAQENAVDHDA